MRHGRGRPWSWLPPAATRDGPGHAIGGSGTAIRMTSQRRGTPPPGRIHIIGGSLRGSRLAVPVLPGLRPTPQRMRQTLFDWLTPVIDGARVLDAFAGSGALGIEALSRGARSATFFERDRAQADALAADLARLHQPQAEVRAVDALQALAAPSSARFTVVFLDPPFGSGLWAQATALLDAGGWLAPRAWVYVEAGTADAWQAPARWQRHRQRDTGAVRGTLFSVSGA